MQDALDDFLSYCRIERRLAPLTCSAYARDVSACLRFLQASGIHSWGEVRPPELRRFLADEATRRPAASSQARTVAALKGFFRFLVENEEIERNPAEVLRTPKKREALPDVLDDRELGRLLRAVERDDVWERHFAGKRERDRLLLALFAFAGLRRSEKGVGITVSATSVRKVLLEAGLQPAPQRARSSWRAFLRAQATSMLACDFLTVETAFLQRIYVLFFISLGTRRIEYLACSSNPDGRWVAQQARNLIMQFGDEQPFRFLIHDRDTKFSHAFDEVFRSEGIKVIRTPVQAPNANAYAERWVRTIRTDCLDRILIFGRCHLEQVLRVYRRHYNEHRPHRALDLLPPDGRDPTPLTTSAHLRRRDLLGGLIHEYEAA